MKEYIGKHKWIISVCVSILILLGLIYYLYATNDLANLLNCKWGLFIAKLTTIEKWLISTTLFSILTLNVLGNLISSFIYGCIFPSSDKKILKNTETIIEVQNSISLEISETGLKIDELIKNSNIDSRDIEQYLKNLPIKNGKDETQAKIDEWYHKKEISLEIKELLFVVVSVFFEQNEVLTSEIARLKSVGNSEVAGLLENIQKYFQEGDADKIKQAYFVRKKNIEKENILILKQSIKATITLFAYQQTIDLYKELILIEPKAEYYFSTAYFLQKLNYFDDAANHYEEALKIYRELAQENPRTYLPNVATSLNNLAILHKDKNEFPQAFEKFEEALKIRRELAQENPRTYLPNVATTLNNLANLHKAKNEFSQALEKYEEALKIYRELAQKNPRTYLPNVATTLNNLAILHKDKNEFSQAFEKYEEALKIRRYLAQENSRTYLPYVAMTLNNLANLHSAKNEFPQALEKYEEALKIQRYLAKENPRTYLPDVATTLNNLAILHKAKNEIPQALEEYEEALKIQRYLAKENPRTYLPDVAMTLNNLAVLHKAKNEIPQALEKYEEALRIQREFAQENPRTYLPDVAITLNNLTVLHFDKNEIPQALEKYEEALKIYRDLAQENPRRYEIDYAQMLIMGVELFKKDKSDLIIAKEILEKYPDIYHAQKLLVRIIGLE